MSRRVAISGWSIFVSVVLTVFMAISIASPCRGDALGVSAPSAPQDEFDNKPINRGVAPSTAATPSPLPQTSFDFDSGRVALALIGVVALIFFLRHLSKSILPGSMVPGRSQTVKVLCRSPLAPKQQVVLIQVGRRIVVAADCNSQLSSLCQITDADEVAALLGEIRRDKAAPITTPFTSWFKTAGDAFKGDDAPPADISAAELDRAESQAAPRGENVDLYQPGDSGSGTADGVSLTSGNGVSALSQRIRELTRQLGGPSRMA